MSNKEDSTCWQCSEFVISFPEFMTSINNLKQKRKKTDEENIVQDILMNGNTTINDKIIKDILEYAVSTSYIKKATYNGKFTYRINTDTNENITCASCGEGILPFDCNAYEVNNEIKYVDIATFEQLANEIVEIKQCLADVKNSATQNYTKIRDSCYDDLKIENSKLLEDCRKKDKIINTLTENLKTFIDNKTSTMECGKSFRDTDKTNNDIGWNVVNHHGVNKRIHCNNTYDWHVPLTNRLYGMQIDENVMENTDDNSRETYLPPSKNSIPTMNKRPTSNDRMYFNEHPERNTLQMPLRNVAIPITRSSETRTKKRKVVLLSASITKPINMIKFNDSLVSGNAIKRAYGGATASQLNIYVQAALIEDKPDTIIINAGTNNFSKKKGTNYRRDGIRSITNRGNLP